MPKSYLIYEKETIYELPVALVDTVREVADFLGVSIRQAFRLIKGTIFHNSYGFFVYSDNEGQCTATTAPREQRTEME